MFRFLILAVSVALAAGVSFEVFQGTSKAAGNGAECDAKCSDIVNEKGNGALGDLLKASPIITLKNVFGMCSKCDIAGFDNMKVNSEKCMKDGDNYDQDVTLSLESLTATCTCKAPQRPSKVAEMVNSNGLPKNTCPSADGSEKLYTNITCEDAGNSGDGETEVTLVADFGKVMITLNAETCSKNNIAYPIKITLDNDKEDIFSYETSNPDEKEAIEGSFNCFANNAEVVVRRVALEIMTLFFPCVTGGSQGSPISNTVRDAATCK